MAIAFHCEHCGRKIEAPDNAGGKWGKCPACHNKVYIPGSDSGEELKLAPVDTADLTKQKQLIDETRRIEQEILSETEDVPDGVVESAAPVYDVSDNELTKDIIIYLRLMADGDLEQAERIEGSIIHCGKRASKILDGISVSEMPEPELADIPPQILAGLVRTLRTKIK